MVISKQRRQKVQSLLLGSEPGQGRQEGRGWLPQPRREGDRWKTMVKQKVFSHSFGMDQQGTKGEGEQPAQPVKAGSEVPELHSIRNQRCCSRGGEQSRKEEDSNGRNSPKPSPSETVSLCQGLPHRFLELVIQQITTLI